MAKIKLIAYILCIFTLTNLNAKVLEVSQLFNRSLVKVKQIKTAKVKSFYGNTKINEENTIDIVTRYDGFITNLNANKTYMSVKKGDTLFSIYSDKILSIQEELKFSKKINDKLYKSALDKLISLDIDTIELEKIKKSNQSIKNIDIHSPINAIVTKKNINNNSAVKKGNLLLQLSDISKLWFIAQVYQKDISDVAVGMSAKIYIDGVEKPIKSKVDYIYPIVDLATKTIQVRFIIDNQNQKIYPNMFAQVKLQTSKEQMLTLPKTAVLNKGGNFYVFKPISKKEFEPVKIEAIRISSNTYQITDGLEANEEVINNALFLLDSDAITNALYEEEDNDW